MPAYDLAVSYRIYPGVSKQPFVHADSKLALAEACLRSFRRALGGARARVHALLDGCPDEYETLFRDHFDARDLVVYRLEGEGNFATFRRQVALLLAQEDAEAVYFAEDDYVYLDDALPEMLAFQRAHADATFVTAYDHLDYYGHPLHHADAEVRFHGRRHWRTASSTCLTFLTTRAHLRRYRGVLETYTRRNYDASIFMALTKQGAFAPADVAGYVKRAAQGDPIPLKAWLKAWRFTPRQLLFGAPARLWAPIPSLATHAQYDTLAPGVDWAREAARP